MLVAQREVMGSDGGHHRIFKYREEKKRCFFSFFLIKMRKD
jgi:hypothetical protein